MKKDNLIIIRTEGGLCSQIYYASLGQYFADKGYQVKYDLTWDGVGPARHHAQAPRGADGLEIRPLPG